MFYPDIVQSITISTSLPVHHHVIEMKGYNYVVSLADIISLSMFYPDIVQSQENEVQRRFQQEDLNRVFSLLSR